MDKEESAELEQDPLHEAKERFKYALKCWGDNRKRYVDDTKFVSGEQWPEAIRTEREKENQPCLVVDKLGQYIRQVVNDSRQNRPSIKVRPVDDSADIEVADVLQGICRHIEDRSNAGVAYDTAIECAVKGGFGFLRVLTEYAGKNTFNQEIAIKRVRNPLAIIIDPDCIERDYSDMRYCFVIDELPDDVFEQQYPKAKKGEGFDFGDIGFDVKEEHELVAEYWTVEIETVKLHLFEDGSTATDEEFQLALSEGLNPPKPLETRDVERRNVKWSKICASGVLEKERDWIGDWIPIIPVLGNEVDIEGEVILTGLCNAGKDAQMLYNFSRSAFAERVALAPKAPYIAAAGQIENYPEWGDANSVNHAVLRYDPQEVGGTLVGAPQRQPASDVPVGFSQDMQLAEHDIQSALGMYQASIGAPSNEKSGKAIIARQREGDTSTFHFHDNLNTAIRHVGRILVDLIPKVYDSKRVVRILGADGSAESAQLDPDQDVSVKKIGSKSIYNIGIGEYDVAVSAGASFATRRAEASEAMMEMARMNPSYLQTHGDLIAEAQDWPMAEKFAARSKLLLPPQLQQSEQDEGEQSPEVMAVVAQAEQAIQQKDMQLQELLQAHQQMQQEMQSLKQQVESKQYDFATKQAELNLKEQELQIKAFEAETNRIEAMQDGSREALIKAEADIAKAGIEADTQVQVASMNQPINVTLANQGDLM